MESLFLTGYGLSISIKNTRLVFKQGINDPLSKEKTNTLTINPKRKEKVEQKLILIHFFIANSL
jgi:hypothetical protein